MKKSPVVIPIYMDAVIQEKLLESNCEVIAKVFERLAIKVQQSELRQSFGVNEDWHKLHKVMGLYDRGCGCYYCQAVHKYVTTKVKAHRLQRRLDSYDYMLRPYDTPEDSKTLKELNKEWRQLRDESHQIRDTLGLK